MKIEGVFTVPEYYPEFACKGGACRHTCCSGLEIDITEQEYYQLITLDCSAALRDRIDLGVRLNTAADVNRYAKIQHNYLGDCKMLDEEGLCALQRECGPAVLNRVCRYYPRSPRIEDCKECSTSNSCERTLEILWKMAAEGKPFRLIEEPLCFDLAGDRREGSEGGEERSLIHREMVELLADESRPLEERLGEIAEDKGTSIDSTDGAISVSVSVAGKKSEGRHKACGWDSLSMLRLAAETFDPLTSVAERAAELIAISGEEALLTELREKYPEYDRFLALVLANDCFYRNIPFGEPALSPEEDREVFASMARLLTLLSAELAPEERDVSLLIDLFACYFRVVDLTSFDRNLYILIKKVCAVEDGGCTNE